MQVNDTKHTSVRVLQSLCCIFQNIDLSINHCQTPQLFPSKNNR